MMPSWVQQVRAGCQQVPCVQMLGDKGGDGDAPEPANSHKEKQHKKE